MTSWFGNYLCFLPPLKTAVVDAAGVLRLGWWSGNEAVRGAAIAMAFDAPPFGDVALVSGIINITQGVLVELDVNLSSVDAYGPAGLFVQTSDGAGFAVLVANAAGAGAIGPVETVDKYTPAVCPSTQQAIPDIVHAVSGLCGHVVEAEGVVCMQCM